MRFPIKWFTLVAVFVFLITSASADKYIYNEKVYDLINDSSINSSLWNSYNYVSGPSEGITLNAYDLPNRTTITNITVYATLYAQRVTFCYDGSAQFFAYGTPVASRGMIGSCTGTNQETQKYVLERNGTYFTGWKYFVYNDTSFIKEINPLNSNFTFTADTTSGATTINEDTNKIRGQSSDSGRNVYFDVFNVTYFEVDALELILDTEDNFQFLDSSITLEANISSLPSDLTNSTTSIWYSNGSVFETNQSELTGNLNTSIHSFNIQEIGEYHWNVYACSITQCSWANENKTFFYGFAEDSLTFTSPITEGISNTFELNITVANAGDLDDATLYYNNTAYSTSITQITPTTYKISKTLNAPTVSATQNKTFYFELDLDGILFNSTINNQTVNNLNIDDCSVFTNKLINFTLFDEVLLSTFTAGEGPFIDAEVLIYPKGSDIPIISYSNNNTNLTFAQVCLENPLGTDEFTMDVLVQYGADDHVNEFYNIRDYLLTGTTAGIATNLYSLSIIDSQEFLVTVKDGGLTTVAGAIVIVSRKYIGEGVFRTVEAPLTDEDGQTLIHLVVSDVIYTFQIVKDGEVLATFDNRVAFCDNLASGDCQIRLNTVDTQITSQDYTNLNDISYSISFDDTTRTATLTFVIPSDAPSLIQLQGFLYDSNVNLSVCSSSLTASSGSVNCAVPIGSGNQTFLFKISKGGIQIGTAIFSLDESLFDIDKGTSVILLFLLIITIPLILISSEVGMVIGVILGIIVASILTLAGEGSFLGVGATLMWLVIAGGIIIWKIGGREG